MDWCARTGDLEGLKFLHQTGSKWTIEVMNAAAAGPDSRCLEYAHVNGCPYDDTITKYAVRSASMEPLEYLVKHKFPWYEKTFKCYTLGPSITYEKVKFLYENGAPLSKHGYELQRIVEIGDDQTVIYALDNNFVGAEKATRYAWTLERLKLLLNYGCKWSPDTPVSS